MRNSGIHSQLSHYHSISLENDKPFSMSSESDKEVLLFPLNMAEFMEPKIEDNIYRMIEECVSKTSKSVGEMVAREAHCEKENREVAGFGAKGKRSSDVRGDRVDLKREQRLRGDSVVSIEKMVFGSSVNMDNVKVEEVEVEVIKSGEMNHHREELRKETVIDAGSSEGESTYNPVQKKNYAPIGNGKKRGPYKKFSQLEKEILVDEAKKFGVGFVVKRQEIARKTLCRWISDGVIRRYGGGRQVGDAQMEEKLMEIIHGYFLECRQVMEKQKIQELARSLSSNSLFTASHGWFQKFYLRHKTSFETMLKSQRTPSS